MTENSQPCAPSQFIALVGVAISPEMWADVPSYCIRQTNNNHWSREFRLKENWGRCENSVIGFYFVGDFLLMLLGAFLI